MPNERDSAAEVLGLPDIFISFRLTWPDDVQILSRLLFPKNICYDKLYHDIYQHQGEYDWLQIRETSRQIGIQEQWTETNGEGEDESEQIQRSNSRADQTTWGKAKAKSLGTGTTQMNGWANGVQASSGQSDSPVIVDGALKNTLRIANQSGSINKTETGAATTSAQENETQTQTEGGGTTQTEGLTIGGGRSKKKMRTKGKGGGISTGISESQKLLPLPKLVHLQQDTGQLKQAVNDQYEKFASELSSLDRQEAFARVGGGKAVKIRTAEVVDPFASPAAQMKAVAWFRRRLYEAHEYFFVPSADEARYQEADRAVLVEDSEEAEESPML